jgi:hypothetical protein
MAVRHPRYSKEELQGKRLLSSILVVKIQYPPRKIKKYN